MMTKILDEKFDQDHLARLIINLFARLDAEHLAQVAEAASELNDSI